MHPTPTHPCKGVAPTLFSLYNISDLDQGSGHTHVTVQHVRVMRPQLQTRYDAAWALSQGTLAKRTPRCGCKGFRGSKYQAKSCKLGIRAGACFTTLKGNLCLGIAHRGLFPSTSPLTLQRIADFWGLVCQGSRRCRPASES